MTSLNRNCFQNLKSHKKLRRKEVLRKSLKRWRNQNTKSRYQLMKILKILSVSTPSKKGLNIQDKCSKNQKSKVGILQSKSLQMIGRF